jgi:anti-sigma regulatory factor (Ser/Thr protein kinase)
MTGDGHVPEALVFADDRELVDVAAPFLAAGLEAGEAVVLVCAEPRRTLLTDAVGSDPRLVGLAPPQVYRRPTQALSRYQELVDQHVAAGRRVRVVGDADHGDGPADWSEWARFEAVAHHAFASYPVRSICVLDRREAPEPVLAAIGDSHPRLWTGDVSGPSPTYTGPEEALRRHGYVGEDPLERSLPTLDLDAVTDLALVRHRLAAVLAEGPMPPHRVHDLVLAVSEVTANALRHGRLPVSVRLWTTPARVLCTVTDCGFGFDLPLSAYLAPDPTRGGLGLYLARQLCDQLNVRWTPAGATVRLAVLVP